MSVKKILVALTGAGISAESGFKTFRDSGGLWEQYNVEDVASIQGWHRNPKLMTDFYNDLRAQLEHAQPNNGHKVLAELEEYFDVRIITQNVDNLHEKAGSTNVIHLHGELTKARPVNDDRESKVIDIGYRASIYGFASYLAPCALVLHAGSGASGSKYNAFKVRHSSRNSIYLLRKNMPLPQQLLNLPLLMAGFGIKLVWFAKKGFGREYAKGLLKGLTMPLKGKKVTFSMRNLPHYARIQLMLWKYTLLRVFNRA